jgi:hypothetical protein
VQVFDPVTGRARASGSRASAPRTPSHAPTVISAQRRRPADPAQRVTTPGTLTTADAASPTPPSTRGKASLPSWALPILDAAKAEIIERCSMLHDPWRISQDWLRQIIKEAVNAQVPPPVVWTVAGTGDRLFIWVSFSRFFLLTIPDKCLQTTAARVRLAQALLRPFCGHGQQPHLSHGVVG